MSLKNKNKTTKNFRYERKFIAPALTYSEIKSTIKHHPYMFSEIYHQRHINNIYFDTINLNNLSANVDGFSNRIKIRIRWYGDLFGRIKKPVLELKIKKMNISCLLIKNFA